jgi:hypothetical protein
MSLRLEVLLMIALTDMRPNLTMAAVLLVAGVAYVLFLSRRNHGGAKSARWIPWASLVAGPLAGLLFWSVDVHVANPTRYPLPSDSTALLGAVLLIGTFVGCVAALVFGIALHLRHRGGG